MPALRCSLALASLALAALFVAEDGSAASFTYQGRLDENGAPKTGTVDLRFDAFALDAGGAPLNLTPVIRDGVPLAAGVFTVEVDFGASVFTGAPVFVQVGVREDVAGNVTSLTGFTNLAPRQAVTATPYAQHAANVGTDAVSSVQIANGSITASDANTTSTSDGLQRRVSSACAANSAVNTINADGTVVCDTDDVGSGAAAWGLTGNSGTTPATNFIGTTDAQPLVLRANGAVAGQIQRPVPANPAAEFGTNIVWGEAGNAINPGVSGATIGGGGGRVGFLGAVSLFNVVTNDFGTVGGGLGNSASEVATVAGGARNIASGSRSTISGGQGGDASGDTSFIGGGLNNEASGRFSMVGGGRANAALGVFAQSPGGRDAVAGGDHSLAAGNRARVRAQASFRGVVGTGEPDTCDDVFGAETCGDEGTFMWADSHDGNFVSQGPNQFLIRVAGGLGIQPGNGTAQELANAPEAPLHVFKGSAGANASANQDAVAVFESNTAAFISILGSVSESRGLQFGEEGDNVDGGIVYNPDNSLHLRANGDVTRLAIEGDGDVGIGTDTAAVTNRLHVRNIPLGGTSPIHHVALVENTDTSGTISVLALKVGAASATTAHNFVTFFNGSNTAIGRIEGNGANVVYATGGADYAEWLPRVDVSESIAPGELVGLHAGGRISKRLDGALQVLIASTGAAVAGNSPGESPEATHTLIAFVGQVQARVCGSVRAGDAVLAAESGSGCGVARDPKHLATHEFDRIAGTAWEGAEGEGEHRVRVAVGLGSGNAERATLLSRIDALEVRLGAQQALVNALLAREAQTLVTSAR